MYLILLVVEWLCGLLSIGDDRRSGGPLAVVVRRDGGRQTVPAGSPLGNWLAACLIWWKEMLVERLSRSAPLPPPDKIRRPRIPRNVKSGDSRLTDSGSQDPEANQSH